MLGVFADDAVDLREISVGLDPGHDRDWERILEVRMGDLGVVIGSIEGQRGSQVICGSGSRAIGADRAACAETETKAVGAVVRRPVVPGRRWWRDVRTECALPRLVGHEFECIGGRRLELWRCIQHEPSIEENASEILELAMGEARLNSGDAEHERAGAGLFEGVMVCQNDCTSDLTIISSAAHPTTPHSPI